jgi:hypothetical protein
MLKETHKDECKGPGMEIPSVQIATSVQMASGLQVASSLRFVKFAKELFHAQRNTQRRV